MRVLVFTDTHGHARYFPVLQKKAVFADAIVCTGDFTVFEQQIAQVLHTLQHWGKPVFLIHGNHEVASNVAQFCKQLPNLQFVHRKAVLFKDALFMGFGGGGFGVVDRSFESMQDVFVKAMKKYPKKKSILLLHGPPFGTALDEVLKGQHCGNKSYLSFIKKYQPSYVFAGHIHECFRRSQKLGKTVLLNPGPEGVLVEL